MTSTDKPEQTAASPAYTIKVCGAWDNYVKPLKARDLSAALLEVGKEIRRASGRPSVVDLFCDGVHVAMIHKPKGHSGGYWQVTKTTEA